MVGPDFKNTLSLSAGPVVEHLSQFRQVFVCLFFLRLYDKGHYIIGTEASLRAVTEFFDENNIQYTTESLETIDGKVVKVLYSKYVLL